MTGNASFWNADAVSATGTMLSVLVAAAVFVCDRFSASSRRTADSDRLLGIIAGDLGIALPPIRTLSKFLNDNAGSRGYACAVTFLAHDDEMDANIESALLDFDVARIERICETANVFSREVSNQLMMLGMLRSASINSLHILKKSTGFDERFDVALNVSKQINMLQKSMVSILNLAISSRGLGKLQEATEITGA